MSFPNDVTAAPEEFVPAALAGECLRSCSAARALDTDVLVTLLPRLKNMVLQLLLGSGCEAAALPELLMSMT